MRRYILIRTALIFPTLIIISLIGFFLSKNVPQDPVLSMMALRGINSDFDYEGVNKQTYKAIYKELHQHKPVFYMSVIPANYPPNRNDLVLFNDEPLYKLFLKNGIESSEAIVLVEKMNARIPESDPHQAGAIKRGINEAIVADDLEPIKAILGEDISKMPGHWLPKFHWHGTDNQYHRWLSGVLRGNMGVSITDGKSALRKVMSAMRWTVWITLWALVISFAAGIFLGIAMVRKAGTPFEWLSSGVMYALYATPLFWLATVLLVFFTTDDYGHWTNIFPTVGVNIVEHGGSFRMLMENTPRLILPVICMSLSSMAYISKQMQSNLRNEMQKPYILAALASGLTRWQTLTRHGLRNALIPMITIMVGAIPASIAGSLVIEVIFNIPGMGRLLYRSIQIADWNVVFGTMLIVGALTVISYLLGDMLYSYFNPRIQYTKDRK